MLETIPLPPALWRAIAPEILLTGGAMGLLMLGVFHARMNESPLMTRFALALMGLAALLLATVEADVHNRWLGGFFIDDSFARFAKVAVLAGCAATLLLSEDWFRRARGWRFEYPVLLLFACVGMMLMISAGDLIALYVGLELQSLALYVLASFPGESRRSTEAGLKYFTLGALSSGLLLFGASMLYGHAGSTGFAEIARAVGRDPSLGATVGMVLLMAGLAFKLSAVPFHMWTPDVYEGAPTPVTALLATASKLAAGALFARALFGALGQSGDVWQDILVFLSAASMLLGAVAGLVQTDLKRLMAYSSIGHMGYALMGLASDTHEGASALMIYLVIYMTMNIGVFAWLVSMRRAEGRSSAINDLAGLSRTHPVHALGLAILMFSLAGIPPLAGFFGKYFVFTAALEAGLAPLAIVGALSSAIAAFYYLRIVKLIYIDEVKEELAPVMALTPRLLFGVCALLTAIGWVPGLKAMGLVAAAEATTAALFK